MDKFSYTIKTEEIKQFKTLKAQYTCVRELVLQIRNDSSNTQADEKSNAFLYRCITRVLITYDKTRLPANIQRTIGRLHNSLIGNHLDMLIPYKDFIATFENLEEVHVTACSPDRVKKLATIFRDNPIPFRFSYTLVNSAKFFSLLTDSIEHMPSMTQDKSLGSCTYSLIMQIEEVKRSLPTDIEYSIIEDILTRQYRCATDERTNLEVFTEEVRVQMEHLTIIAATMQEKLLRG